MNDFVELRHYMAIVLRRWWILFLGAIIGAVIGYQVSQRIPRVYQSTATLVVGQFIQSSSLNNRDIQTSEQLALSYAEIGRRQPVLEAAAAALDLDVPWQQLKKQVQFRPVEGTQLLELTAEAGAPRDAEAIAREVARQLILLSPTTATQGEGDEESAQFIQQRLLSLQERIDSGQRRIESLDRRMAVATTAEELSSLQEEIDTLQELITEWESNYARLLSLAEDETPVNYLAMIEEPYASRSPVRPKVRLNTLIAVVAGLLLALIPVFVLEHLDDTIKSTDDLNRLVDLPPLGTVGKIKGKSYQDKLLASLDPFSPASEAYRMMRSSIRFVSEEYPCRTILVTSGLFGEGKSLTVANLGLAMAQAGNKTLIVDADLRRPAQHKIFGVPNEGGLAELLRSQELGFEDQLRETTTESLCLLTSGAVPVNPAELLSSDYTRSLLSALADFADIVILDCPPVLSTTDPALLASVVDGVVLVVEAGGTERQALRRTISILQQADANLLGVLLNRFSGALGSGYYKPHRPRGEDHDRQSDPGRWWRLPISRTATPNGVSEIAVGNGTETETQQSE